MNQTELLLEHARDEIDRRLIEFGFNPWHIDDFRRLTPGERVRQMSTLCRSLSEAGERHAARLK